MNAQQALSFVVQSVTYSTPLLLASLGELFSERVGVINIGLEGLMLTGCLAGVWGATLTHSPYLGLLFALVVGMAGGGLFALFAVGLRRDQVIVGTTLNFLALGLTKTGSRAAVLCTSGTAVANLHPAVLEAAHAGVPLMVVSADRPARLRGTNANQTTLQVGIFGPLVTTHDLAEAADVDALTDTLASAGPVHWNVQLDEPLTPSDRWRVPADLTPGILDFTGGGSLWQELRDRYDIQLDRTTAVLEAVVLDEESCGQLGVRTATSGILLTRTTFDADGRCVEYARDAYRADRAAFEVNASLAR